MAEPKRAFVTGSSGFIGKHLVQRLKQAGWEVTGYDLKEGNDILDWDNLLKSMKGANVVVHLAAEKSVPKSWAKYARFYEVNITGTHKVLHAAFGWQVNKVIFISSSSAKTPISPYGVSKRAGEHLAKIFNDSSDSMKVISARLFNVFGPGQLADDPYSAVIPRFITELLNGKQPIIHGDGKQSRDFTYVEDVCNAIYKLCESDFSGNFYEIGYGSSTRILDLALKISKILKIQNLEFLIGNRRDGDIDQSIADQKLMLGITWDKVGFEEGLRRTVEWYKNESLLPVLR